MNKMTKIIIFLFFISPVSSNEVFKLKNKEEPIFCWWARLYDHLISSVSKALETDDIRWSYNLAHQQKIGSSLFFNLNTSFDDTGDMKNKNIIILVILFMGSPF